MLVWHPTATRKYYSLRGKAWVGGDASKPKVVLHTTETLGMPNYSAPPHMTFYAQRDTRLLYQHIGFDKAAYSMRDNALEDDKFMYQIEMIGYAQNVPNYDDTFYQNVAWLLKWFNEEMGVPLEFADFSVMRYGATAPQRMNDATVRAFSGILGHAHVGINVDTHWDPGRLDVAKVESFLTTPPPPPPEGKAEYMFPIRRGDGVSGQRPEKKQDVQLWAQKMKLMGQGSGQGLDGYADQSFLDQVFVVVGSKLGGSYFSGAEGAIFDQVYAKYFANPGPKGNDGADGVDGVDGTNGINGINGKDGINGTNGKDGINGKDGADGVDGADGADGEVKAGTVLNLSQQAVVDSVE